MAEVDKVLYWTPRILGILLILFISIFSFDALEEGIVIWLMNLIPSLLLVVVLLVAWKYELIGGMIYFLLALAFFVETVAVRGQEWWAASIIAVPVCLIGALFIANAKMKK